MGRRIFSIFVLSLSVAAAMILAGCGGSPASGAKAFQPSTPAAATSASGTSASATPSSTADTSSSTSSSASPGTSAATSPASSSSASPTASASSSPTSSTAAASTAAAAGSSTAAATPTPVSSTETFDAYPSTAVVTAHMEGDTWYSCNCGGTGSQPASENLTQNGSAVATTITGSGGGVSGWLWYSAFSSANASNWIMDYEITPTTNLANATALEFDGNQTGGLGNFVFGTECNYGYNPSGKTVWRFWTTSGSETWGTTSYACPITQTNHTYHVQMHFVASSSQYQVSHVKVTDVTAGSVVEDDTNLGTFNSVGEYRPRQLYRHSAGRSYQQYLGCTVPEHNDRTVVVFAWSNAVKPTKRGARQAAFGWGGSQSTSGRRERHQRSRLAERKLLRSRSDSISPATWKYNSSMVEQRGAARFTTMRAIGPM